MLSKQFIQDYFNADFKGINSLLSEVLIPIFQDYEEGYTEITVQTDKAKDMAKAAHIKTIKHVATLGGLAFDIKVFDVTLDDNSRIHKSRKKIQELVRQFVDRFEGAFIVFHYDDPKDRSWRLSYLEKRESNAASTNAKRYTYLCGQQYPCRTLADRFNKLQSKELTAVNLEDAFSVETLSDEFFDEYRYFYQDLVNFVKYENNLLDGFIDYANGDKELAEKYARDYIKKLMGRLVFIQFLQNKAWLNNDIHYTHTLFDRCSEKQKENFLDNVLEPLFFGVFNTPKQEREAYFRSNRWDMKLYEQWKDFPYLNGGLFECDELDKLSLPLPDYFFSNPEKKDRVRKPDDKYYSDACGIFDFFDRYNFTIDESDPLDREVGVDPEMLGKIFENLLEDNKDKGAFYTPKEIVEYMCKEALVAYLVDEARRKSEVNKQRQDNFEDAIRAFVTDPEMTVTRMQRYGDQQLKDLNDSLCDVRICDPAIGSGAFPMGLLNLLMNCRVALNNALRKGQPRAWLKKEIIQNNIYGVDIEKGAIDIARLRFWLSIVVDLDDPEALPNFDYKFMQGNSLLEQYEGVDLSIITQNKSKDHEALQITMFEDQLDVLRHQLQNHLHDYFATTDHRKKEVLRSEIRENVNQQLAEQQIRVSFPSQYDVSANTDFFLWHTWFADVFNRPGKEGFDIVIGNPPYISYYSNTGSSLSQEERRILVNNFDVVVKPNDRINTMNLMIERGLTLLRKRGHLSFIVNKTVAVLPSYITTRQYILDKSQIAYYVPELSPFAAIVDCIILGLNKDNGNVPYQSQLVNDSLTGSKEFCPKDFQSNRLLEFISPENSDLLSKIEKCPKKLSDYLIVNRGVNIGGCFDDFLSTTQKSPLYRKYLPGTANVKKFGYSWSEDDGYMILDQALERKLKSTGKTIALGDPQRYDKERLIIPESSQTITATYCNEPYYTGYGLMIGTRISNDYSLRFLCGILNSKLITFYAIKKEILRKGNKATPHVGTKGLLALPIPECSPEQQSELEALVLSMEQKRQKDFNATDIDIENKIDKLVYQLYGLNEDDIATIENQ